MATDRADATPTLIQSLQRGMRVVDMVAERGPLTAKAISASTGIVQATTYHLLRTLVFEEYLLRSPDGSYALGPQFASIARREGPARDYRLIREEMAQLSAVTRAHVAIASLQRGDVEVWSVIAHPCAPRVDHWPGTRLPGHATAIGKGVISQMSEAQRDEYLSRNPLRRYTSHTITSRERLERQLRDGPVFTSAHEFGYGVSCMAAAMPRVTGMASVGISYASDRSSPGREDLEENILRSAAVVSNLLSHSGVPGHHIVA